MSSMSCDASKDEDMVRLRVRLRVIVRVRLMVRLRVRLRLMVKLRVRVTRSQDCTLPVTPRQCTATTKVKVESLAVQGSALREI